MIDQTDAFERTEEDYLRHTTLHKRDSKGKHRVWWMERDGSKYRTHAGLADGKKAVSDWTQAKAASQDTDEDQAIFEVRAKYKHQLEREYRFTVAELDSVKDEFVEPMLAKTYSKFVGPLMYFQPKLDGIRCIMTKDGMFTRQGQPIIAVPHLHAELVPLFEEWPDLILDGELYNHDLRDDFGAISSIVRKKNPTAEQLELAEKVMQYHVYDIVDTAKSFSTRTNLLRNLLVSYQGSIVIVPTTLCFTEEEFDHAYGEAVAAGYEGGMGRLDGVYQLGARSKFLLKRKDFMTEEFVVERVEEGNGNWTGAAKRFVLRNNNDDLDTFGAGVRGSREEMTRVLLRYQVEGPPDSVTLRFFGRSPDRVPRFPVVIDIHWDGRKD